MRRTSTFAFAFAVLVTARVAHADDTSTSTSTSTSTPSTPAGGTRALAAGAAIVPGVLVHGSGARVVGKRVTAKKLAITGGIALGSALTSVALVALTGASRRVVGPLAAAGVMSVGVFSTSLLADLYAVLAPEGGTGTPLREVAPVEAM